MNTDKVIALARKHLGGLMESSARLCLADAIALVNRGDLESARARAIKSLAYSIGIMHADYIRAAAVIVSPDVRLSSGRIFSHKRMQNGAQEVLCAEGNDEMSEAEWQEYSTIVRNRSRRAALDRIIFPGGGRYLWGALAGKDNITKRQQVAALFGHKLNRSQCRYHVVEEIMLSAAGIHKADYTYAECERLLIAWIKGD